MEILLGKYKKEEDKVDAVRTYTNPPYWMMNILHLAINEKLFTPNTIVICSYTSYIDSKRMGAYMYKGTLGDIVDVAVLWTLGLTLEQRQYTLAHEIGHCDHWKRNIDLKSVEEMEDYAHNIAYRLTGLEWKLAQEM